ncbi:MAG: transketolase family protein [bacterium]|nr:transketolase family protein [bacterium]
MASVASRQSFGLALAELGESHPNIVVCDADLSKSTMSCHFAEKFPERFFEFGISEANMLGAGAGMALTGKVPFVCSFACFISGRFDTIRISIAYSRANVKIVGTHAGVGIGEDGHSQMGLEDLGLMRSLPGMVVIQPADDIETRQAVKFAAEHQGPVYLRLTRQKLDDVNDSSYEFQVGKGVTLADGSGLTLIATGGTVAHALKAKGLLAARGVDARVVNIHTIKPFDAELIAKCARETGLLMTVEDHSIIGGLGSAVAEVIAEGAPAKLKRWGVLDVFGESGTPEDMYRAHKIDAEGIAETAEQFVANAQG